MATPNRGRAPKGKMKTGICENHNYFNPKTDETGDCPKCASGEHITVEVKRLSDFRCPVCDGNLTPIKEGPGKWVWIAIAIAVVAVAVIILCISIPSGEEETGTSPTEQVTQAPVDSVEKAVETPVVDEPTAQPAEPAKADAQPAAPAQPKEPTASTHKLPYGTWSGGWKNGQPNGNGTMTYSTSHVIDSRDPKGREAQAGEYVIGEWDNGHLVQGRWFKNDGSKESIIIGKAG